MIKGNTNHEFFDSAAAAYAKEVELFGLEPFPIRQVLETDPIDEAQALMYALICAEVCASG